MLRTPYVTQVIDAVFGRVEDPVGIDLPSHDAPSSSVDYAQQFASAAVRTTLSR